MPRFKEEEKKMIKMPKILLIIIIIIGLAILGTISWYYLSISPVDKANNEETQITIPIGTGTNSIANILKDNNVIKNELAFKIYVKLNKVTDFQAGIYKLNKSMGLREITEILQTGKMEDPNQIKLTYIEGKTIRDLAKTIEEITNNNERAVYDTLSDKKYLAGLIDNYWFITDEILNKDIYYSLEGYLFPDTYTLKNKDVTVAEIFETMLKRTDNILTEYKEKIEKSKYSTHELLTIASIIEKESLNNEGRKDVSSVIYNRLQKGMPIQSDVTTYYAIKVDMAERDLYQAEIDKENPYNTRGPNMEGKLPIGPVSSCRQVEYRSGYWTK